MVRFLPLTTDADDNVVDGKCWDNHELYELCDKACVAGLAKMPELYDIFQRRSHEAPVLSAADPLAFAHRLSLRRRRPRSPSPVSPMSSVVCSPVVWKSSRHSAFEELLHFHGTHGAGTLRPIALSLRSWDPDFLSYCRAAGVAPLDVPEGGGVIIELNDDEEREVTERVMRRTMHTSGSWPCTFLRPTTRSGSGPPSSPWVSSGLWREETSPTPMSGIHDLKTGAFRLVIPSCHDLISLSLWRLLLPKPLQWRRSTSAVVPAEVHLVGFGVHPELLWRPFSPDGSFSGRCRVGVGPELIILPISIGAARSSSLPNDPS